MRWKGKERKGKEEGSRRSDRIASGGDRVRARGERVMPQPQPQPQPQPPI
ncbi:hypothetical protein PanWU01x14_316890 [Parasponia andersonii]|uniref:Uncharacterized protein n=1 Tax=Parasponia andersonii TaxID=3476 RepID=A0A2P5AMT7_PARAD|nr:hypothetical protein PanWU01x14_316890 [Parasponia andersonii]